MVPPKEFFGGYMKATRLSWQYVGVVVFLWGLVFAVASSTLIQDSLARPPTESEFLAAQLLGDQVALWFDKLDNRPNNVGIFSIRVSSPLESDYSGVIEAEIIKHLRAIGNISVISCAECRAPQVKVNGDRLVVTKGAADLESLRELGKKNGAATFLTMDVYRTTLNVIAQASLYQTGSGEVLFTEQFKIPAIDFSNAAIQFLFEAGTGFVLGAKPSTQSDNLPLEGDLSLLEELGFGKGGLNIGGIFSGSQGTIGYIDPTLGFRGRFGASPVTWLFSLGTGFGLASDKSGIVGRGSYDIFLGSFTVIGVSGTWLFPVRSKQDPSSTLNGMIGIHIGLSLGR